MRFANFTNSILFTFLIVAFLFPLNFSVNAQEETLFKINYFNNQELPEISANEIWTDDDYISFRGQYTPNTTLNIQIGDQSYTVQVDSKGNWAINEKFEVGNYNVVISTDSDVFGYLVHIGQKKPANSLQRENELKVSSNQNNSGNINFPEFTKFSTFAIGAVLLIFFILMVLKRRGRKQNEENIS